MSVNLLAEGQEDWRSGFAASARARRDRFANTQLLTSVTGAPLLADALAGSDCRVTDIMPLDTHAILIGVVQDVHFGPRGRLGHFRRRLHHGSHSALGNRS